MILKPFLARSGNAPLIMAHRGGSFEAPEETLFAFQHAVECGSDILELDVHLTADGHVVVNHDDTVDRTTHGSGKIAEMTLSQLSSLDAAYRFEPADAPGTFPHRGKGMTLITLEEVVDAFPNTRLNIDIKANSMQLIERVLTIVDDYDASERVCIASTATQYPTAKRIVDTVPLHMCRSFTALPFLQLLFTMNTSNPFIPPYDVLQLPVSWDGFVIITPKRVARFQALGLPVHAWTINDETEMRWLIDLGIDGIVTDRPRFLKKLLSTSSVCA